MDKRILSSLLAALFVCCTASNSWAELAAPGNYQAAGGYGGDWTPGTAPLFDDLGGNLYELPLTGLAANTRYNFKILDAGTSTPAWGQPEVPDNGGGSPDNWFLTDDNGDATIMLDRNDNSADGFLRADDRITVSTDFTEFPTFYATGTWMDEAGGAADWDAADPLFAMTDLGNGLYSLDATISTPGTYEFKATAGSFDYQWGTNGRLNDSANYEFNIVAEDQEVTFLLDLAKGGISYSTETFLPGDTDNDGVVELADDFYPIRDHWLVHTFLRSEGNLDNTGASEGVVDIADFRQWKDNWTGDPAAIAAAWASLGGTAVPEPSSVVLSLLAGTGLLAVARRQK